MQSSAPRTWRNQFPDYPVDGMPEIPASWSDLSWRNDACPSFLVNGALSVYVDYPDASMSEFPEARLSGDLERFSLHRMQDGQHVDGDGFIAGADTWPELLALVAKHSG